jgi:radical SAM superfamily enzyme YgiQ (UPF0313 family)
MPKIQFLQLPVPPPAFYAATGNVPLACASLASAIVQNKEIGSSWEVSILEPQDTDSLGDNLLIDQIAKSEPDFLGLSLYLWNSERSLYIAQKIKEKSPKTKILIGGPEVNPDNPFVIHSEGYDFAFSGESEDRLPEFLKRYSQNTNWKSIHGFSYRDSKGKMQPFTPQENINFPLNEYPSPYLQNILKVEPNRSTYIETVRGCRSSCTYCFYPKSSNVLRGLEESDLRRLIGGLKEKGAKELVFLDPTFNHRPRFEDLLDLLIDINFDKQMKMFAEIRPEGMNPHLAKKMSQAGFYRLELGMQSINKETLKKVQRFGDPQKVAEVAKFLVAEGMELLLDLIIGLPNDKPEDVLRGVEFFKTNGLEEWVQVFPLSILPGTKMRSNAMEDGLIYLQTPPYRVIETPTFTPEDMVETLFLAEDILERRIDETPRINLINPNNFLYGRTFDSNNPDSFQNCLKPSGRHFSLWLERNSFQEIESQIIDLITKKIQLEPFCTLDIIFYSDRIPEISILKKIQKIIQSAKPSYLKLALSLRDEDLQHRICVVLKNNSFSWDAINPILSMGIPIFVDTNFQLLLGNVYNDEIGYRIMDPNLDRKDLQYLKENFDPEKIAFWSAPLEEQWTLEVLGYGE